MQRPEIISALTPIIGAFEKYSIPYFIGGSVASSIYGMARSTQDIDIVADFKQHHILLLKKELDELYYIDEDMIGEAVRNNASFNLIHLETAIKIDVFILKDMEFDLNALNRKLKDSLDDDKNAAFSLLPRKI